MALIKLSSEVSLFTSTEFDPLKIAKKRRMSLKVTAPMLLKLYVGLEHIFTKVQKFLFHLYKITIE